MFALPIFPSRPTYCDRGIAEEVPWRAAVVTVRWTVTGRKKPCSFEQGFVLALLVFLGRPTYCRCRLDSPVDCQRQTFLVSPYEKDLVLLNEVFVLALPSFPGSHPPSIVGVHELNFCVRDGNRWSLMTINTNYVDGS